MRSACSRNETALHEIMQNGPERFRIIVPKPLEEICS